MAKQKTASATADALLDEMVAADALTKSPSPDALKRITATAEYLREVQQQREEAEKQLEMMRREERRVAQDVLPQLMDEAGVRELVLESGARILRSEEIYASVSASNAPAVADWMERHNFGALVKSAFSIPLPRGSKDTARLRTLLAANHIRFEETRTIHPQTLKAFVRESLAAGRELPAQISTHLQPIVKMKDVSTNSKE